MREKVHGHIKDALEASARISVAALDDAQTLGDLGLDDLDSVELIMTLEETLNIELPESELSAESTNTIAEITDLILRKIP